MRNTRMTAAIARHIAWTFAAALVAAPGAALAGPSLYDLTIFLTGVDPFAAAFYGPAPGVPVLPAVTPPPLAVSATGNVAVVSILANATYEFPNQYRTAPYALGGLGFARYSALSVAAAGSSTVKSSDWVIGYQVGAGLVFPLDDRWALDVSYRYFATTQPELKNAAGVAFKTDVSTHNLLVGARFKL